MLWTNFTRGAFWYFPLFRCTEILNNYCTHAYCIWICYSELITNKHEGNNNPSNIFARALLVQRVTWLNMPQLKLAKIRWYPFARIENTFSISSSLHILSRFLLFSDKYICPVESCCITLASVSYAFFRLFFCMSIQTGNIFILEDKIRICTPS